MSCSAALCPTRCPASRAVCACAQYELVYTYVGDIVISVNPFKNTGCYGKSIRAKFKGASRRTLPPHIYALARTAGGRGPPQLAAPAL